MGLGKNQARNTIYLKIKDGSFYTSDDKENADPYEYVSGQIVGFNYRDEVFNKKPIKKFQISLVDGSTKYVLSVPVQSPAYSSFISFAKNTDLSTPVNLHAKMNESTQNGETVTRTSILISKGDADNKTFSKGFYTKDGPNKLPQFKKVSINGQDIWDKTDYLNFLADVVENDLKPQVSAPAGNGSVVFKELPTLPVAIEHVDDLPF